MESEGDRSGGLGWKTRHILHITDIKAQIESSTPSLTTHDSYLHPIRLAEMTSQREGYAAKLYQINSDPTRIAPTWSRVTSTPW